jgi:DNA-binding NtrC family response regulator
VYCIQSVIDHGFVPIFIQKLSFFNNGPLVRREALFALTNILWRGNFEQAKNVVDAGAMRRLILLGKRALISRKKPTTPQKSIEDLLPICTTVLEAIVHPFKKAGAERDYLTKLANSITEISKDFFREAETDSCHQVVDLLQVCRNTLAEYVQ